MAEAAFSYVLELTSSPSAEPALGLADYARGGTRPVSYRLRVVYLPLESVGNRDHTRNLRGDVNGQILG